MPALQLGWNNSPLVSIIIPLYNRADLIQDTLDSVLSQTYSNWECIVVDDHSADHGAELVSHYCAKDSRFSLFIRPQARKKGANSCRNIGIHHSKGNYLIFLDADDILHPTCLELRVEKIQVFPNLDFWVFATELFNRKPGDMGVLLNVLTEEEDYLKRFLKMDILWLSTGPIWKKQTLTKLEGWDERLESWQDWDLSVRALIRGGEFKYFGGVDNYWRTNIENNLGSSSTSPKHLESHYYLLQKVKKELTDRGGIESEVSSSVSYLFFWLARRWLKYNQLRQALKTISPRNVGWVNFLKFFPIVLLLRPKYIRILGIKYLELSNDPSNSLFKASTFKKIKANAR